MDISRSAGAPRSDPLSSTPPMQLSRPAPPPPRQISQRFLSIETRRAACTHLTVTRMYDTFGAHRCNLCHRVPWNGYVWWCSQDHGTWLPQYEYMNEANPAWHVSHDTKPEGEEVDIASWMAKAIAEGHYTEDQIQFIKAQRQHVHNTINYLENCYSISGYDGSAFTPPGLAPRRPDLRPTPSVVTPIVVDDPTSAFTDENPPSAPDDIIALQSVESGSTTTDEYETPPTSPEDIITLPSVGSNPYQPLSVINGREEQPKLEAEEQNSAITIDGAHLGIQAEKQDQELFFFEPPAPVLKSTDLEDDKQGYGLQLEPGTSLSKSMNLVSNTHQPELDFGSSPPLPPANSSELQEQASEPSIEQTPQFPIVGDSETYEHPYEHAADSPLPFPTLLGSELYEHSTGVSSVASGSLPHGATAILPAETTTPTTASVNLDAREQDDEPHSPLSTPMINLICPTSHASSDQLPPEESTPLSDPLIQCATEPTSNTGRFSAQFPKPPPMGLGPSMFPICNYRACSSCRYFWKDRAWASIESSMPDTTNLPPPHELANRRISDRNIVAKIGLRPVPATPAHYRSWVELHMGWSRHIPISSNVLSRQNSQWASVDTDLDDTESSEVDGKDITKRGLRASLKKAWRHVVPRRRDSSRSTTDSNRLSRRFRRRQEDTEDGDIGLSGASSKISSEIGLEGRMDLISGSERELEEAALTPLPNSDGATDIEGEFQDVELGEFQDGEVELEDGVAVTEEGVEMGSADILIQV